MTRERQVADGFSGLSVQRSVPVREQVALRLREAITEQRFRPGQLLIERELCEATGASRASVREALRRLETEGLVVSVPGRGTHVTRLGPEEAMQLYEVRATLEGMAGRLFAERANEVQIEALDAAVRRIEQVVGKPPSILRAKAAFYEALFEGAGNLEMCRLLEMIHRRVTLLRGLSLSVPGRPAQSVREMHAILAAARLRDPEATAQRCIEHVYAAAEAALIALGSGDNA